MDTKQPFKWLKKEKTLYRLAIGCCVSSVVLFISLLFGSLPVAASCPPNINYGETIQCSIDVSGEVDSYSFVANTGDVILARMSATQCCNNRQIRLYKEGDVDPLVSKLGYPRAEFSYIITSNYTYTLSTNFSVGSGGSFTGDYNLHLQRLNGPSNATPIAYGQTLTDTITLGAEFDAYSFSANTGDVILVRMSASQCCNNREARLYAPDGSLLVSKLGYPRAEFKYAITTSGNYTLLTNFSGGSGGSLTGDYNLHLQRLNNPGNATPITYGQTLTSAITLTAEFGAYSFSANSGDEILVRMSASQCCNYREIRLYAPDGSLLTSKLGYPRAEFKYAITTSGNYTLLTNFSGGSGGSLTGDYNLHLQRLNNPGNATPITYGQTLTSAITLTAEFGAYSFSANSGDEILVRMSASQCCNYREIRLYAPDGSLLTSNLGYRSVELTYAITASGNYTLLTNFSGGSGGSLTGDYNLHLQRLNNPGNAVSISSGDTVTGTIAFGAELNAYTFSVDSGDIILVRMSASGCCDDRRIRLYMPDGSLLTSKQSYPVVEFTQTIITSGNYTLLADFDGLFTADYSLHLQRLNNPGNVTSIFHGQPETGNITLGAEFDAYTFPANSGDVILVRMSASGCCDDRQIRLYKPDGSLLISKYNYPAVEFTQAITVSGNYSLLTGFEGLVTTDYSLSLTCLVLPCDAAPINEYSISGQVQDTFQNPISDVEISTNTGMSVTTDSSGYYTITNLNDGIYTLIPSKSNYIFSPLSLTVNLPPDATNRNFVGTPIGASDPLFPQQWGLHKIEIAGAWAQSQGSSNTTIAVIDTGTDYTHVDLGGGKTLTGIDTDYVNNDNDAMDDKGHGTHVTGIAAANTNNGQGIAGVCPLCKILPLKTLNSAGTGNFADVATAIRYAADQGVEVINMSLGGDSCTAALADAINYAYARNVTIVAASGNSCPVKVALGLETFVVSYPAQFDRVIAVGATNAFDNRADFSNYGATLDVTAPGVGIVSTHLNGTYKRLDGTSMASPMVAGLVGLILSENPSLTPAQVQRIIELSADDIGSVGWDAQTGWGRINADNALQTTVGTIASAPPAVCLNPANVQVTTFSTSEENLVTLYRQLRDEVLMSTPLGAYYVNLFYENGPELAGILLTNPALLNRTADFLDNASDEFESLLPNSTLDRTLTQELYNEANALVQDLAAQGSENFRSEMEQTWADLALDEHIGEKTTDIWDQMNPTAIYLPIIIK